MKKVCKSEYKARTSVHTQTCQESLMEVCSTAMNPKCVDDRHNEQNTVLYESFTTKWNLPDLVLR